LHSNSFSGVIAKNEILIVNWTWLPYLAVIFRFKEGVIR